MAWKLLFATGELFRDGFKDQWDALKTAYDAAGCRIKKADALQMVSGTVVYRQKYISVTGKHDVIRSDGSYTGKTYNYKTSIPRMEKFLLVDDDFKPTAVQRAWFMKNHQKV